MWSSRDMSKLKLSLAVGPYDRTRALIDGSVLMDGVELYGMTLSPEEIFFRAFRHAEFDICELSMSSFTVNTARGDCPYIGVPAFVSRAFRHNAIYVRTDRIKKPEDLKGKRIGVPEYQLTANVWARLILEDDFGVKPSDVTWVRGGIDHPERPEKIKIKLPADVKLENAPEGTTITQLLAEGRIDAFIAPRPPSLALKANPNIGWLFPDPVAAAQDWYKRTGIFPIMHLLGIRRELAEQHPWLPGAALKAFQQSKAMALDLMADTSASKVTLPFVDERLKEAKDVMGEDFWSYGVAPNRKTLDAFLRRHHAEGLSSRLVSVDEMFHPATYERFSI
jgi:4,5-dihydroxyphthalate decarboxylase